MVDTTKCQEKHIVNIFAHDFKFYFQILQERDNLKGEFNGPKQTLFKSRTLWKTLESEV